jgi:hypothetical protein
MQKKHISTPRYLSITFASGHHFLVILFAWKAKNIMEDPSSIDNKKV